MNDLFHQLSSGLFAANDAAGGMLAGLGVGMELVIILAVHFIMAYPIYVIGQKCNYASPWFAFVPILNILVLLDAAGLELWYIILFLIPCVNVVVGLYVWWKVCEAMNKPGWISLLMLVPCVGVFVPFYIALG